MKFDPTTFDPTGMVTGRAVFGSQVAAVAGTVRTAKSERRQDQRITQR
jgi:hypothetical protein